jgi:glutathione synthase/RimK-type ligase-like ATP-grasp enzyme
MAQDPWLMEQAENKIRQLSLAHALGFAIPNTIVTNDPTRIANFAKRFSSIVKPLRNGVLGDQQNSEVIFTNRLSFLREEDRGTIEAVPVIVQEEIEKAADIRVSVVGKTAFATAIQSQADPEARVDWRRGDVLSMAHVVHELPTGVASKCLSLVEAFGLRFGAIDLVLDRGGAYWFLEINPNGQWGWRQAKTGQPIARAIVDELTEISRS